MIKLFKKYIFPFKIAATFIGTIIGAGFASGQEILQFFGYYGLSGIAGVILTAILFTVYGYIILYIGYKCQAKSHQEVLKYVGGDWLGNLMDIVITLFLLGTFTAMVAGGGAIIKEQFNYPFFLGNIIMLVVSMGTTILGLKGIMNAVSSMVPLLLISIFVLPVYTIYQESFSFLLNLNEVVIMDGPVSNWFLSGLIYVSYNLILSIAVMGPMGAEVQNKKHFKRAAVMGGIGLGLGAFAILLPLLSNMPEIINYEIPLIYITDDFAFWIQIFYSLILLIEIYTTAVGNLFGVAARFRSSYGLSYQTNVIIIGGIALIFSQFGFSNLIHYFYPVVGYTGLILMAGLLFSFCKAKLR